MKAKPLEVWEFAVLHRGLFNTFAFDEAERERVVEMAERSPKIGRALLAVALLDAEEGGAGIAALARSLLNAAHVR